MADERLKWREVSPGAFQARSEVATYTVLPPMRDGAVSLQIDSFRGKRIGSKNQTHWFVSQEDAMRFAQTDAESRGENVAREANEHEARDFPNEGDAFWEARKQGADRVIAHRQENYAIRGFEVARIYYSTGKWHVGTWTRLSSDDPMFEHRALPIASYIGRGAGESYEKTGTPGQWVQTAEESAPVVYEPSGKWNVIRIGDHSRLKYDGARVGEVFKITDGWEWCLYQSGGCGTSDSKQAALEELKHQYLHYLSMYPSASESPQANARRKVGPLKWHRKSDGHYVAKGIRGEYVVRRERPDRRKGILPWGTYFLDSPTAHTAIKTWNTADEAKTFAQALDSILSDPSLCKPHVAPKPARPQFPILAEPKGAESRRPKEGSADEPSVDFETWAEKAGYSGVPRHLIPISVIESWYADRDPKDEKYRRPQNQNRAAKERMQRWDVFGAKGKKRLGTVWGRSYREAMLEAQLTFKHEPDLLVFESDGRVMEAAEDARPAADNPAALIPWLRLSRDTEQYDKAIANAAKLGPISDCHGVYALLHELLGREDQEVYLVVMTDVKDHLRGVTEVARGQRSAVSVGIEDIVRVVTASGAEGCLCVHNHPSSDATPSKADAELTDAIAKAFKELNVTFADHVVIGRGQYASFADQCVYNADGSVKKRFNRKKLGDEIYDD